MEKLLQTGLTVQNPILRALVEGLRILHGRLDEALGGRAFPDLFDVKARKKRLDASCLAGLVSLSPDDSATMSGSPLFYD